jgi:dTDP-3-amino-3,4,6-trideoxy-alpha-D-glucose transaminase
MNTPPVRLNDFQAQWRCVRETAFAALDRVGASGWLILGDEVSQFESALASVFGVKHAVGCASGLDGIEISLRVLGLRPGEYVITTPLSAFATTLAILRVGGHPVFVDVDESGLLDLTRVGSYLKQFKSETIFVLPVHLYGHCLDLEQLDALRQREEIRIVEDCAQSIGATSHSHSCGTVGDLAATSFYPTKNLGCMGDGGAVLTKFDEYAEAARQYRNYGQESKYLHSLLGMNSRLDELQAALLHDAFLPHLPEWTARRQEVAARYREGLDNACFRLPIAPAHSNSVYHLFPVLVEGDREDFQRHLRSSGVETAVHYPTLISEQPAMKNQKFTLLDDLPVARRFARTEVSLPIHPFLSPEAVERVIDACNSWKSL